MFKTVFDVVVFVDYDNCGAFCHDYLLFFSCRIASLSALVVLSLLGCQIISEVEVTSFLMFNNTWFKRSLLVGRVSGWVMFVSEPFLLCPMGGILFVLVLDCFVCQCFVTGVWLRVWPVAWLIG